MEILFVDNYNYDIFNPRFGGAQRSNLLLQACAEVGHVDVITFKDSNRKCNINNCDIVCQQIIEDRITSKTEQHRKLRCLFADRYEIFGAVNKEKQDVIDKIVSKKKYDYIVIRYVPDAVNCGLMKYTDKLIIDMDDNPVAVTIRENKKFFEIQKRSWMSHIFHWHEIHSQKRVLRKIIKNTKIVFASNLDDVKDGVHYLPNVPFGDIESHLSDFTKTSPHLLFVGLLYYNPNYNGIKHFLDNIMPLIRKKVPEVTVSIVGDYGSMNIEPWSNDSQVQFKGFVDDLDAEYLNARVAIVPVYEGAGTNIKVLEAMRQKRPCVTTLTGARGFGENFQNGKQILISKDDQEFADNVINILTSEQANHTIAESAYQAVNLHYSKSAFLDIVKNSLQ